MEKKYVCKFCNKKFTSGKSLGGHIRIHSNEYTVASDSFNGKNPKMKNNNKKRLVEHKQLCCGECGSNHMDCHCVGEKMVMDSQSDTETTSSAPTRKRSKKLMKQSNSESFSTSSASEIDQEHKDTALSLMMMSIDSKGHNLVVNSLAESSENNSEILETKASSGEQLNVKNQDLKTDKVAVDDQLRSTNDADSYSSDSDYFMNGPKKSDSDISVEGSLRNTELNSFKNGDELGVKEGGSKYQLRKSKRVLPSSYESDSCADRNMKIHRSGDCKMLKKASGANKSSKAHEFKSSQALGGHKRSHSIESQEQKIKHKAAADMRIDLNLPVQDIDV
ncbi:zinc finger protein ZAT4 [Brassica rapa]|uniref:C2H2-type domain-containing protein n=1 Tax=Brassica campestris TaxID=3711 RepID=M4D7J2_BRACM|nr:zinc finger protein ZAT4 [Brassica rapa]XP_033132177.1 zinc finger protein ZAT4 [Brassica rapa]